MEFETLFKRNEMKIAFGMVCVCSRKAKMPIIHLADCKKWRNEPTNKEKNVKNQIENEKKTPKEKRKIISLVMSHIMFIRNLWQRLCFGSINMLLFYYRRMCNEAHRKCKSRKVLSQTRRKKRDISFRAIFPYDVDGQQHRKKKREVSAAIYQISEIIYLNQ